MKYKELYKKYLLNKERYNSMTVDEKSSKEGMSLKKETIEILKKVRNIEAAVNKKNLPTGNYK